MFEKIVLRCSEDGSPVTVGRLAEALLFYQNVHLILDRGAVLDLGSKLGLEAFIALLRRPNISAVYCEEQLATITFGASGLSQKHGYGALKAIGDGKNKNLRGKTDRLEWTIRSRLGASAPKARKFVQQFFDAVPLRRLSGDYYVPGGVTEAARGDIRDPHYVRDAVAAALPIAIAVPFQKGPFEFKIIDDANEKGPFFIWTDIDFDAINAARKAASLDPITPALLANHILTARADLTYAAHYGGDFVTSRVSSAILRVKHAELLQRTGIHGREIQQFTEIVLPECPSLMEVIDSGEHTFEEFSRLLSKSDAFRRFLHGVGPDQKLAAEYLKEISKEAWIDRLPGKTLRYVAQLAIGTLVPKPVEIALSATDALLLDKLLGGWRANHFVERRLKPFVRGAR